MVKFQELFENTEKELFLMTNQPFPFGKENIGIKMILTPEFAKFSPKRTASDFNVKMIDFRFFDKLPVALIISDNKSGMIHFPKSEGEIDFDFGFYCSDMSSVSYLIDIYQYYWDKGKTVEDLSIDE